MLFFVISIGKIGPKGKERQNIAQTEIELLYVLLISLPIITVIPEPGGRGPLQLTLFQIGPVGGWGADFPNLYFWHPLFSPSGITGLILHKTRVLFTWLLRSKVHSKDKSTEILI